MRRGRGGQRLGSRRQMLDGDGGKGASKGGAHEVGNEKQGGNKEKARAGRIIGNKERRICGGRGKCGKTAQVRDRGERGRANRGG